MGSILIECGEVHPVTFFIQVQGCAMRKGANTLNKWRVKPEKGAQKMESWKAIVRGVRAHKWHKRDEHSQYLCALSVELLSAFISGKSMITENEINALFSKFFQSKYCGFRKKFSACHARQILSFLPYTYICTRAAARHVNHFDLLAR